MSEPTLIHLDDGKANAIDDAFLDRLEHDVAAARTAIVITGRAKIFSAGFALPALFGRDRAGMGAFMRRFSEVVLALYAAPLPVVVAIRGHALAGGCVLALVADHRVMSPAGATIGLGEVQLGMGLPIGALEVLRALVPGSALKPIALEGRSFGAHEALSLGLVDEVADDVEAAAMDKAVALARGGAGYGQIKRALRRPVLEEIARRDDELERWLDTWTDPETQRRVGALVDKLTKR